MSSSYDPKVCATCGNLLQDGRCWRCDANEAAREKRWRTGDQGGVRPERLVSDRGCFSLADALGGTWQSRENKLKIFIDTKNNSWTITNAQGQQSKQKWEPQNKSGNHMTFFNNGGKAIDARLRSDGVLVMSGRGKPVDFVFLDNGREYRTCPNCYCKTEIEISICKHCCKEFR